MADSWKNIKITTSSILKYTLSLPEAQIFDSCKPPPRKKAFPPYTLPIPSAIDDFLTAEGLPPSISISISNAYVHRAVALRTRVKDLLDGVLASLPDTDHDPFLPNRLIDRQISIYAQTLEAMKSKAIQQARNALSLHSESSKSRKLPFNHEYTPLLEKYFEYNAYPSAQDRRVLAKKSMMSTKQIEIWFQNHRRRAKNGGKVLRRLTCNPLPVELSIKSLEHDMPMLSLPHEQRTFRKESESLSADLAPCLNQSTLKPIGFSLSTLESPPHAFPMPYPPGCGYNPFPTSNGIFKFPVSDWPRKQSAMLAIGRSAIIDMDEFIESFASKLNLRTPLKAKGCLDDFKPEICPGWWAATVTTPSPAPHPSFISPSRLSSLRSRRLQSDAQLLNLNPSLPSANPGSLACVQRQSIPPNTRASRSTSIASTRSQTRSVSSSSSASSSSSVATPNSSPYLLSRSDLPCDHHFDSIDVFPPVDSSTGLYFSVDDAHHSRYCLTKF